MPSWPPICAKEARMLRLTGPNKLAGRLRPSASRARLASAPPKLSTNEGERKVPRIRLPATTRSRATWMAAFRPKRLSTSRVTMLASPGLIPGRGEGMPASTSDRPMANAAILAIWWSCGVVWISIVERVIESADSGEFDADLVGQAKRRFSGAAEPALLDAVLPRAGVAGHARPAVFNGDDAGAERSRDCDALVAGQAGLGEDLSAAADDDPVGHRASPQSGEQPAHQRRGGAQHEPVAASEVSHVASSRWRVSTCCWPRK